MFTGLSPSLQVGALAALMMACWSAIFWATFNESFFYDDLHFIRPYTWAELASVFYGPNDPDGIELQALRPIATLLFGLQGVLFGEHVVLQRLFVAALMGGLLWAVGLLLIQCGLSLRHLIVVFALFAASRVFASLVLWITLGSLILCYTFMTLTILHYLRWLEAPGTLRLPLWILATATLAVFIREEAYTLPAAVPLVWWTFSDHQTGWRRPVAGALQIAAIVAVHALLRWALLPDARMPALSGNSMHGMWLSVQSSWLPGGLETMGSVDRLVSLLWRGFAALVMAVFLIATSGRARKQVVGLCVLGVMLCTPALGVARSFGIAMPSLAFYSALSIVVVELHRLVAARSTARHVWTPVVASLLVLGLAVGTGGGIRRSIYVAEALDDNSVIRVLRDGEFLLGSHSELATIPDTLRRTKMARFADLGIRSRDDLAQLEYRLAEDPDPFKQRRETRSPLFLEKYNYFSY